VESDSDVALIAPPDGPGVSDDEEVSTIFGTVADSGNGMVDIGSAKVTVQDTLSVELEGVAVAVDRDSDWLLLDSGFHLGLALWWEGGVSVNTEDSLGLVGLAVIVGTSILVIGLSLKWISLGILQSKVVVATLAALTLEVLRAIDDLLLGHLKQLTLLDEVS